MALPLIPVFLAGFAALVRALVPTAALSFGNVLKIIIWGKIFKVLAGLGVGYVTYEISNFGVDMLYQQFQAMQGSIPADTLNILALMGVFEAISIVLSSMSVALAIRGYDKFTNSFTLIGRL